MKSLFYKDVKNLSQQGKALLLILVLWIGISISQKQIEFLGGMLAVYAAVLPISAFAYDERSGWDKYALVLSYTRRQMVISKYLFALVSLGASMAMVAMIGLGIKYDPGELFCLIGIFTAVGLTAIDLILPCVFWLGVEKGRVIMMLIFLIPTLIAVMGSEMLGKITLDLESAVTAALAVSILLLPVSMFVSIRIYEAKEF